MKQLQLIKQTYPFDWVKVSLNSLIKVLENDFDRYCKLTIKKLYENHLIFDDTKTSFIVSNDYGITMTRELVDEQNIETFTLSLSNGVDKV